MRNRIFVVTLIAMALAATLAVASEKPLVPVESKKVCMINEQVFDKDQIPVKVEGRTYYGCCEMCKKALANDASKRTAVDPLTGEKVDKATAVIAADENGAVYYFASEKNLEKFNSKRISLR